MSIQHIYDYAWNYDEGVLLQTAALSHRGYDLYTETVLNKPPLLVWWIQLAFAIGGIGIVQARLAILLVTVGALWLLGELAKLWWGRGADLLAMGLYILLPESIVRANIVMNDVPAMGMIVGALVTATYFYRRPHWAWAVATGLFYGIGIGLHPLLFFMILPIGMLLAWQPNIGWQWSHVIKAGLIVGGTAVLVTISWLVWVDWHGFWQWVIVYNRTPLDTALQAEADKNLWVLAQAHWQHSYLLLPALFSFGWLWQQTHTDKRFFLIITAVWYSTTLLILLTLQPMWKHYTLFALIPLVILLSGGLWLSMQSFSAKKPIARWLVWTSMIIFLLVSIFSSRHWRIWNPADKETVRILQENVPAESFVISDNPFLLFVADMFVPPTLADGSQKRISTQLLHAADVIQATWQYDATHVVLTKNGRFQQFPKLLGWVNTVGTPVATLADVSITQIPSTPSTDIDINATFNDTIILDGSTVTIDKTNTGWLIDGTLFWETAVSLPTDYKFFVHLLDDSGNLVTQHDGEPQQGWLPTSTWIPNQLVIDTFHLQLPPETAVGNYSLTVGIYTWPDMQRLPAQSSSGESAPNNIIPIIQFQLPVNHEP